MRKLVVALAVATAAAIPPAAAAAEGLPVVEVEVGTQKLLGPGAAPNCDDPGVAWISADGAGVLHGVKVGSTICSIMQGGGARRVFRVEVFAKRKKAPTDAPGGGEAPAGGPAPAGGAAPEGA